MLPDLFLRSESTIALAPEELFDRLRWFARLYSRMHPAHIRPDVEPPLLSEGVRFTATERFGPEHRTYHFVVTTYDPVTRQVVLDAESVTHFGPLRLHSSLTVELIVTKLGTGSRIESRQSIRLRPSWAARFLLTRRTRTRLAAHAAAEAAGAYALLSAADWPPSA